MRSISRNFGFVTRLYIGDEILTKIVENNIFKIEKAFYDKRYDDVAKDSGILTETLLQFIAEVDHGTLKELINKLQQKMTFPLEVLDAMHQIKKFRNVASHSSVRREQTFIMDIDDNDAIQILKALFRITKYAAIISNEMVVDFEELTILKKWKFNKESYQPKEEQEVKFESIDDSTEVKLKPLMEIIVSTKQFAIPTYQRKYTWSLESIEVLLSDINLRKDDKKQHYMGALAIAVKKKEHEISRIIDGQQRITTTLILAKAINDTFVAKGWKRPQELEDLSYVISEKYVNKATINNDQLFVNEILSLDQDISTRPIPDEKFRKSAAYINYVYLMQYLKEKDRSFLVEFFTTFTMNFVVAELRFEREIDDEIDIFENLNSKGTDLSDWDLIKNYFFTRFESKTLIESEDQIECVIKNEIAVPSTTKLGNDWDKKIKGFFNVYNRIQFIKQRNQVSDNKDVPHKLFKEVWPTNKKEKFTAVNKFRDELLDVKKYLTIYNIMKSQDFINNAYSPLAFMKLHLKNLNEKDVHYPLVIEMIYKNIIWEGSNIKKVEKQEQLLQLVKTIDFYITRLLVVKGTGQSLGTVFDKILLNYRNNIDTIAQNSWNELSNLSGDNAMPGFDQFIKALANPIKADSSMRIMRSVEEHFSNNGKNSGKHTILMNPTLEHIFPQNPNSSWSREGLEESEFKRILKNQYLNKVGNHLILNNKLNIKVSNNGFKTKISHYKDDESKLIWGYNEGGMILQNLILKDSFRFADIDKRTEQIQDICKIIYKDLF